MSNSSLVTYKRISNKKNSPRNHVIDTITIHCIVGQWTAKQACDYFATTDRDCSCNYVVGKDGSIGLCVDERDRSWCSSNAENDHRAVTIEVASDITPPYAVTPEAYEALIKLVADVCKRNRIKELKWKADKSLIGIVSKQNMTVHRWFANKDCPGDYLYERHSHIARKVNAMLMSGQASSKVEVIDLIVGEIVQYTGNKHYVSSVSTIGKNCTPGKAKVTAIACSGKYRVHLVAEAGGGSNVYGWVDAALIVRDSKALVVGAKVRVNAGAKTYTGGPLKSFVYSTTYDVISINGDRVVIGLGKTITAAMHKKDITVV